MLFSNREIVGLILVLTKFAAFSFYIMGNWATSGYTKTEWSINVDDAPLELQKKGPTDYVSK